MNTCIRYFALIPLLLVSLSTWAGKSAPEATVMMVYISTLRCEAQHPKLKKPMQAAYDAWVKRNQKYVDSAKKMLDFKAIENQYKSTKANDKYFSLATCESYIKRLQDPANDIKE